MTHSCLAATVCPSPPVAAGARRLSLKRAGAQFSLSGTDGAFSGYASLFGVADQSGDVVMPGAFRDSLADRGAAGIRMLWQHDPAMPLGVWETVAEDARGLFVAGRLDLEVAKARELLALIRSGAVDGLSIGFKTLRSQRDAATGLRRLYRIDLWEISLVTFPMLPQARISAVKSCLPPTADDDHRLIRAIRRAEAALGA